MATKKSRRLLSDAHIEALRDFEVRALIWDTKVNGLRLRVGAHRFSWSYFQQHRLHGNRSTTCKNLGQWPAVNVSDARKAALQIAGKEAGGRIIPGRRSAVKFADAFAEYLDHLTRNSAKKGKPDRWRKNVEKLGKIILPVWEKWTLADMSSRPDIVAQWHRQITRDHGPVSANHCCRVIRAAYKRAAKLDLSLSKADIPTAAVEYNDETPSQKGLAFKDFPKWLAAWEQIEAPIRRAYHMTGLLVGPRPGELARLKWTDVRPKARALIIGKAKAGADISIPLSIPIVQALKLARDNADEGEELIFPGCAQVGHRDKLPARGNMLRHTYRTVAADLGIDELLSHFLLGHAPEGVSQKYIARMILAAGPALRDAQRRMSRRIVGLLHPTVKAPALAPDSPQDTEASLLPTLP
jgi:integrase